MESSPHNRLVGPATVLIVVGALCIVAGGLVAAITGPLDLFRGSWLAAYLVLVCGVAQFAMGTVELGHATGHASVPRGTGWTQVVCFNVGNAAVIVGTLTREPFVVDGAGVLLLVTLGIALYGARSSATHSLGALAGFTADSWVSGFLTWVYRVFLVLLVISLPVGAVLAHLGVG